MVGGVQATIDCVSLVLPRQTIRSTTLSLNQSVQVFELFGQESKLMLRLFYLPCYTATCMKKAAGRKTTITNDAITQEIELVSRMADARQLFLASTLNLSWRLALSVLIPLIGGIQLDKKFNSSPALTLIGLLVAFAFGSLAVWATVKEVNELQSVNQKQENKEN